MNKYVLFLLGFLTFRMPYGMSGFSLYFYFFAIAVLFFVSINQTLKYFPKSSDSTKVIYLMMLAITIIPFLVRLILGYGFTINTLRSFMLQLMLLNLFTFSIRESFWDNMKIIDYILSIYIIINFVTVLLYPDGFFTYTVQETRVTRAWFLGQKNHLIRTIIPALFISCISSFHLKGHIITIKNIVLYILSFVSIYLTGSSTGVIVILIIGCGLVAFYFIKKWDYFNLSIIFWGYLIISVAVVFFSFQDTFSSYIESFFEKDESLSGRTLVWQWTLARLNNSPILGFGFHSGEEWHDVIGFSFNNNIFVSHPHNYMLYILLQGGFVLLTLFIVLFHLINYYTRSIRNMEEIKLLTIMLFSFFLAAITESLTNAPLMFPLLGLFTIFIDRKQLSNYKYILI